MCELVFRVRTDLHLENLKVLLDPKQIFVEDADPDNILPPNGTSVGSVGTVGSEIEL